MGTTNTMCVNLAGSDLAKRVDDLDNARTVTVNDVVADIVIERVFDQCRSEETFDCALAVGRQVNAKIDAVGVQAFVTQTLAESDEITRMRIEDTARKFLATVCK